jgi:OOP family OmpA-OmpF porin
VEVKESMYRPLLRARLGRVSRVPRPRSHPRKIQVWLAALVIGPAWAATARAQAPNIELGRVHASSHPEALAELEPTAVPEQGDFNAAVLASYSYALLTLEDGSGETLSTPIRHRAGVDYFVGIGLGGRVAIGASLPTVMYQTGDAIPSELGAPSVPRLSLGDATLEARTTLLPPGALGGVGLGALARLALPTGAVGSFASDGDPRGELRFLAELGLIGVTARGALGVRLRGEEQHFASETFGHDLPWGFGLLVRPQAFGVDDEGNWLATIEASGAVAMTPEFLARRQSPALFSLAARRAFGDISLRIGVDLPLSGAPGVPLVRAFAGVGWAPRALDADEDGISDENDGCTELAEDRDGFEDGDGCPDFDNDGDGVADSEDRCPGELEDMDGHLDEDGCPDPDDDADGIPDTGDACPREPGRASKDPKLTGCPARDRDVDGIADPDDKCPRKAEDRDGFEDADGCPDLDDDRDGVKEPDDACPRVAGPARSDPALNGCPSPDRDGDGIDDAADRCPEEAETHDGVTDEDGCPEPAATPARAPLARFASDGKRTLLELRQPITLETDQNGTRVAESSLGVVRAIAALLNQHPDHVLLVASKPTGTDAAAEQEALTRAFAVVSTLQHITHRDEVAETVGFGAVRGVPKATSGGLGFLVRVPAAKGTP